MQFTDIYQWLKIHKVENMAGLQDINVNEEEIV